MVGAGEIKYPGWTKTGTAAGSLILIYQGLQEENLDQKLPGPIGWGLMQRASSSHIAKKQEMLKIPNTKPRKSDGDRRLKLRSSNIHAMNQDISLKPVTVILRYENQQIKNWH